MVGFDARAGLVILLDSATGLFVEYRYTDFDLDLDNEGGWFSFGPRETMSANIQSHHALAGISFRF